MYTHYVVIGQPVASSLSFFHRVWSCALRYRSYIGQGLRHQWLRSAEHGHHLPIKGHLTHALATPTCGWFFLCFAWDISPGPAVEALGV